ncbi:hypothetical protein MRX96_002656 [Rhipicephalus microplus]
MMVLLHPDTARISVQHVSVRAGAATTQAAVTADAAPAITHDDSNAEGRIFAISSVGGNVIYHVDKTKATALTAGNTSAVAPLNPERKVLALTSIVGPEKGNGSKVVTRSSNVDVEFPPALESLHQISLFINPFGSLTSLGSDYGLDSYSYDPPDLSNATRIDGSALRKSSFDESDDPSSKEDSHTVVRSILDEILDLATASEPKEPLESTTQNLFGEDATRLEGHFQRPFRAAYLSPPSHAPPVVLPSVRFAKDSVCSHGVEDHYRVKPTCGAVQYGNHKLVRDSGRSFAIYLNDLLTRCKVQKALLHCLVASVYGFQKPSSENDNALTVGIIEFNEKIPAGEGLAEDFQETFQVYLLQLIAALIVFEERVTSHIGEDGHPDVPIPCQAMFGTALLTALRQQHKAHLHAHWMSLVMCALPFAGKSLTQLVLSVASQVCSNLEVAVAAPSASNSPLEQEGMSTYPPDYLTLLVEGLTLLCHYCLLDSAAPAAIIYNLIHVFSNTDPHKDMHARESGSSLDPILSTRRTLLSNLPRLLAALVSVWEAVSREEKDPFQLSPKLAQLWVMGAPQAKLENSYMCKSHKVVKQHILSFLSPISMTYGSNFMAAVAVVWYERRKKNTSVQRKWSPDQLLLVELVSAIKVLPMDSVVQVVRQVIRQPPPTNHDRKKRVPLEVSMLQFFLAYVQHTPGTQLQESWSSLLGLWKDGLQLTAMPLGAVPPCLGEHNKCIADITQKVIEACSTVASASLEQTTWLRRNLAVRPGPQPDIMGSDADAEGDMVAASEGILVNDADTTEQAAVQPAYNPTSYAQYSVQALSVLAEFLAPVLDVVYVSEEKEKVVPLLSGIMFYVTPYLRKPQGSQCTQLSGLLATGVEPVGLPTHPQGMAT